MATTAQNNIVFTPGGVPRSLKYQVDSGGSHDINQGDLVYFVTASYFVYPLDTDAHAAQLAGVAMRSSFMNPYGTKLYDPQIEVAFGCIASFKTTTGDTYHDGDTLYIGADAQTVTNTVGGNTHPIGYVKILTAPVIGTAYTIAGGSGVNIDAFVVAQFPVALA